jgi:hypothetical protein
MLAKRGYRTHNKKEKKKKEKCSQSERTEHAARPLKSQIKAVITY